MKQNTTHSSITVSVKMALSYIRSVEGSGDKDDECLSIATNQLNRALSLLEKAASWYSVNDMLPPQEEEVITLSDSGRICFAHIVDKTKAKDYNGWNIPDIAFWTPFELSEEMKKFYNTTNV